VLDVQAHTYAHAQIFSDDAITDFISPAYRPHVHARPCVEAGRNPVFLGPADLGAPLYLLRSRMSDALRYDDPAARVRAEQAVAAGGGAAFFQQPDWGRALRRAVGSSTGVFETEAERERAILEDLLAAREELNGRLRTQSVKHLCFPWAVAGAVAEQCARRAGYETAWADRLGGRHTVREGRQPPSPDAPQTPLHFQPARARPAVGALGEVPSFALQVTRFGATPSTDLVHRADVIGVRGVGAMAAEQSAGGGGSAAAQGVHPHFGVDALLDGFADVNLALGYFVYGADQMVRRVVLHQITLGARAQGGLREKRSPCAG
jgi:hypothetical protein